MAELHDGDRTLSMSWPGGLPAPTLDGDTAVYRDVLPDVDLRVTASALGFSEVLVVKTPKVARHERLSTIHFELTGRFVSVDPLFSDEGPAARRRNSPSRHRQPPRGSR